MKARTIIFYVGLTIISLGFLFAGGGKAFAISAAVKQNQALNLEVWFIRMVGFLELIGVIGLWLPKFRTYAAICLMVIMIGAIGAHVGAAQPQNVIPATLFFAILVAVVALDNKNKLSLKIT